MPSIVNFTHIFLGHDHEVCVNYSEKHFHKKSLDCDLHKFHKNPALHFDLPDCEGFIAQKTSTHNFNYYQFLSDFQKLSFELRGPPTVV